MQDALTAGLESGVCTFVLPCDHPTATPDDRELREGTTCSATTLFGKDLNQLGRFRSLFISQLPQIGTSSVGKAAAVRSSRAVLEADGKQVVFRHVVTLTR